jgi:hypothetical protein
MSFFHVAHTHSFSCICLIKTVRTANQSLRALYSRLFMPKYVSISIHSIFWLRSIYGSLRPYYSLEFRILLIHRGICCIYSAKHEYEDLVLLHVSTKLVLTSVRMLDFYSSFLLSLLE